jgi:hypothetical protein
MLMDELFGLSISEGAISNILACISHTRFESCAAAFKHIAASC